MKQEMAKAVEHTRRMNEAAAALAQITAKQEAASEWESLKHFNKSLGLHYGHLALRKIWEQELNLRYKIDYLQQRYENITTWRLADVIFYLCALKIIDPASYLNAYTGKSSFFYRPWDKVHLDNFYTSLDFVYEHKEELLEHAVKSHLQTAHKEVKIAFFDCTNCYFETPYDDKTWQIIRYTREVCQELRRQGFSPEAIEEYLASDDFMQELEEELELRKDELLRMRGKSKEGRFALPLVTVALAVDVDGFPLDCKVFVGNLSEIYTLDTVLDSMQQKYGVNDVYFVADKGLNSAGNIKSLTDRGLGYVVSQQVANKSDDFTTQMLKLDGYRNCYFDGTELRCSAEPVDANRYRCKIAPHKISGRVKLNNEFTVCGNPKQTGDD